MLKTWFFVLFDKFVWANFFWKKMLHQIIIIMVINLHYICINLSNLRYASFACLDINLRIHTLVTTVFVIQYYDVHVHAFVKDR